MALDTELRFTPEGATRWDWWPLARLLTVLAVFAALAYLRLGWTLDVGLVVTLPRRVFEVFSLFTLLSSVLAHLYLVLLCFPIYAIVTLNDWFYDASVRAIQGTFPIRSSRILAWGGLCGELLLFAAAIALALRVFQ